MAGTTTAASEDPAARLAAAAAAAAATGASPTAAVRLLLVRVPYTTAQRGVRIGRWKVRCILTAGTGLVRSMHSALSRQRPT